MSGGGAKGFAHIAVLTVLDSLKIPIDYIAGTSMGGIAGALYSIGYNSHELKKLAFRSDWEEIFTDQPPRRDLPYFQKKDMGKYQLEFGVEGFELIPPSGLIYGQKVSLLFSSLTFPYGDVEDFDQLPIPFRCIAVDLVTGNEVVIGKGPLPKAMRATMAIPTVFSPVEWGDSLLVDGGLVNNLPVDVVKKMGADIVIAVDVEAPLKERNELNSALAVLNQTVTMLGIENKRENLKMVDILIRPDIKEFTPADFSNDKIRKIIRRGYDAVNDSLPRLIDLKQKYFSSESQRRDVSSQIIKNVDVVGNVKLSKSQVLNQLNLQVNNVFNPEDMKRRISDLKTLGYYEHITCQVNPTAEDSVELTITFIKKRKPIIHRIEILNNKNLPFKFIYNLLGIQPGQRLDTDLLNQKIMSMYGLGYFERIDYSIESMSESKIILRIFVKELPLRKLRVGIRYDDVHKLVAVVGGQATNLFVPGLRLESEFQFAGLNKYRLRASYPSRALNLPIYPFFSLGYKNISTDIFNGFGSRIAAYQDRSTSGEVGIGILIGKSFNAEISYQHEYMDIKPEIALPDPEMFPSWKHNLRRIDAIVNVDWLDDSLIPCDGFYFTSRFEGSLKDLKSDVHYYFLDMSVDLYKTFLKRHTTRFHSYLGLSSVKLPLYKYFRKHSPLYFVGMAPDQLAGNKMTVLRFDYRYEIQSGLFFKLMANMALSLEYIVDGTTYYGENLWGTGIGIKLSSPVGPLEIIFSRGSASLFGPAKSQNEIYFVLGYRF